MVISPDLPIFSVIPELTEALAVSNRVILQASPGAGKTTAVPLALIDQPWLEGKQIVILEPRRIAARAAASRMASMLGEKVGQSVGYQIRSESLQSPATKILVVTEGILTRKLQNDPSLENTALIIFDEFHERNLHGDLSLAFALQSQECLRDDLKLLVMSATLDTANLSALLGNAPLISSEGRSFPVENIHLRDSVTQTRHLPGAVIPIIRQVIKDETGSILVFLPGVREIKQLERELHADPFLCASKNLLIAPLYGDMDKKSQDSAISPAPDGQRKIVLSTNIAETSLTIEGITIVIDSGFERLMMFDPSSGMERLITQKISRSSADQRSGRAGRLSAGKCYRLWSEHDHRSLSHHRQAEILTCDLAPLALELAVWGVQSADELSWIDLPSSSAFSHATDLLRSLDALDLQNKITPHGQKMLLLGVHPRLAHMVIRGALIGYGREAVILGAILSERDIFSKTPIRSADLRERFLIVASASAATASESVRTVLKTASELRNRLASLNLSAFEKNDFTDEKVGILLALAYPDRIAKSRIQKEARYLMSGGKEAFLNPDEELSSREWLVVADCDGHATYSRIYLCAPIYPDQLEKYFPHLIRLSTTLRWNEEAMRVEAREITALGAITITSRPLPVSETPDVLQCLLEGIRRHGLHYLPWNEESNQLLARLRALHHHFPELLADDLNDSWLLTNLETWLLPHLNSQCTLRECQNLNLTTILSSILSWEESQKLDQLFPSHFVVPTGTKIPIDYSDPASAVLAVRIQEVFGIHRHPSILEGNLPLTLHLLSPARRPIQVTRDLVGFWNGSYREVKKELKGRYPKHYWPDDPMNAQPTVKTKKHLSL